MSTRWTARQTVAPDADVDSLILVKDDEERAIVNGGIDRYVAEMERENVSAHSAPTGEDGGS